MLYGEFYENLRNGSIEEHIWLSASGIINHLGLGKHFDPFVSIKYQIYLRLQPIIEE